MKLPAGSSELADEGARPKDTRAAEDFYVRTFAEPTFEVTGIQSGSPLVPRTVIPVEAMAVVDGRQSCYVVAPEGLERRTITTRGSTTDLLEVTGGLAEGERVVLRAPDVHGIPLDATTEDSPGDPARERTASPSRSDQASIISRTRHSPGSMQTTRSGRWRFTARSSSPVNEPVFAA